MPRTTLFRLIAAIALGIALLPAPLDAQRTPAEKDAALLRLLESKLSHEGKQPVHNFMLYAENEPAGYVFHEGVGIVGRDETPIDADYQYNIASITKTFVAVVVLQLVEEGVLDLQDKAAGQILRIVEE